MTVTNMHLFDDDVVNLSSGMTFYCSLGLIVMVLVLVRFSLETSATSWVIPVTMPDHMCSRVSEQGPFYVSERRLYDIIYLHSVAVTWIQGF